MKVCKGLCEKAPGAPIDIWASSGDGQVEEVPLTDGRFRASEQIRGVLVFAGLGCLGEWAGSQAFDTVGADPQAVPSES